MNRVSKGGIFRGGIFRAVAGWVKRKVATARLVLMSYPFAAAPMACVCEGGDFMCTSCPKELR